MRSLVCGALAGAFLALINVAAFAGESAADERGNLLSITPLGEPALNIAAVRIEGSGNGLTILQTAPAVASLANRLDVSITGDLNGRGTDAAPAPLIGALPWGALTQAGEGNAMVVSLTGSENLFAASQNGVSNTLMASISGVANQAAVSQTGASNVASFSQAGNGNMVSITQTSW